MEPLFQEMIDTLRGSQDALRLEMEQVARAGSTDEAALQHLCEIGRSFQEQAHSLLVMMLYQDAPSGLVEEAEDLVSFFSGAVHQLDAMQMPEKQVS